MLRLALLRTEIQVEVDRTRIKEEEVRPEVAEEEEAVTEGKATVEELNTIGGREETTGRWRRWELPCDRKRNRCLTFLLLEKSSVPSVRKIDSLTFFSLLLAVFYV